MKKLLCTSLCIVVMTSACSQKSINETSHKAGEVAAEVVEVVEEGYHATVKGSKAAYRQMRDGYKKRRRLPEDREADSDHHELSRDQQSHPRSIDEIEVVRDGDDFY